MNGSFKSESQRRKRRTPPVAKIDRDRETWAWLSAQDCRSGTADYKVGPDQTAIETVRERIGVMRGAKRLVPHGRRYTAAVQLAEAGCSDALVQAVTGNRALAMVQKYWARADQKRQSKRAQQVRDS
ncbi:hypothetical protein PVT71_11490 [Salipiger sp. H15]|uniref:Tyr recombinase domain-containing protein n=1 Tax=Alloyangia sp. H15 TaxID=3029062 RepID=A0AAU8AE31_9RHOB